MGYTTRSLIILCFYIHESGLIEFDRALVLG